MKVNEFEKMTPEQFMASIRDLYEKTHFDPDPYCEIYPFEAWLYDFNSVLHTFLWVFPGGISTLEDNIIDSEVK